MAQYTGPAESVYFEQMEEIIDLLSRQSGIGHSTDAYLNMLYGINHRGLGNPVPSVQDNGSLVLFTRPDLNLSYDNLSKQRVLMPLATTQDEPPTIQRAVRCLLDPRSAGRGIQSQLIDNTNPFMAILTNNLISLSGWPDIQPETYTSKEGVMREAWSMVTGIAKFNGKFDLVANFRNTQGSPIMLIILTWLYYMYGVRFENMDPYMKNIINLRMDAKTRIYHFVFDPSRQYIQNWAVTGFGGNPVNFPIGNIFNYVGTDTFNRAQEQLPITFECNVAEYNDPISFREFNTLVQAYNPELMIVYTNPNGKMTTRGEESGTWVKIPRVLLKEANYMGIPLIHEDTGELFWYCTIANYNKLLGV